MLGYYPRGELGEIFLKAGKDGTDVNILINEAAMMASFALQHGGSVKTIREAMPRDTEGKAEGPIGTLLDLILKEELEEWEKEMLS